MDDGVDAGDVVTPFYDPMLAKLIVWGEDRPSAIARMRSALTETRVGGIKTNIDLLHRILACPDFVAGRYATDLIERSIGTMERPALSDDEAAMAAAIAAVHHKRTQTHKRPVQSPNGSRWGTLARAAAVKRSEHWRP